jgi:GTP-binding protein
MTKEQVIEEMQPQRVIAIVGRPNVGKSALFNRIVGKRVAIVHEQSGVTRDRLMYETSWDEQRFELIDTGGVGRMDGTESGDVIEDGTRRQVDLAIEDAAVVILVTDVTSGLAPLDESVAHLLHQSGRKVVLAANKADHDGLDASSAEFERLGFPVFAVSALHRRGIGSLMTEALKGLPESGRENIENPLRVAVVGRPNAGKSSYINRLLKNDRVIVSEVPGTTRDSIEVPFQVGRGDQARHYLLIDTAGMRKSRKAPAVEKFSVIRAEKSIEQADVVVHVLDATQGPSGQDKKIAARVIEHRKGCLLMINKWDLAQEAGVTQRAYGKALREAVPFLDFVPTVFCSAQSGYNIRRTVDAIDHVASQVELKISTGLLNRVIQQAVQRVQPPVVSGRRLKINYAVQVSTKPVIIRIFVNSPKRVKPAYKKYLLKNLRQAFGFEGAPVVLQFRSKGKNPYDEGHE